MTTLNPRNFPFIVGVVTVGALTGAAALGLVACNSQSPSASPAASAAIVKPTAGRLTIEVTKDGFVPSQAEVEVGKPVTLVVTRKVERTCATEIVIKDFGIEQELPLDKPVEVTLTPTKAGPIHFACGMDMITGELIAK